MMYKRIFAGGKQPRFVAMATRRKMKIIQQVLGNVHVAPREFYVNIWISNICSAGRWVQQQQPRSPAIASRRSTRIGTRTRMLPAAAAVGENLCRAALDCRRPERFKQPTPDTHTLTHTQHTFPGSSDARWMSRQAHSFFERQIN
jgi:hypothetical protein